MSDLLPWLSLGLLGAYHGLNPGMGWLFAVALGLQERRRWAVLRAFGPIAAGHAASVSVVVLLLGAAQLWVDAVAAARRSAARRWSRSGSTSCSSRSRTRSWVGMRVGPADLAVWSFLMASAHGAGLMLMPLLIGLGADSAAHTAHAAGATAPAPLDGAGSLALVNVLAVGVHTAAMFLVMAAIALVVYEKLGLQDPAHGLDQPGPDLGRHADR